MSDAMVNNTAAPRSARAAALERPMAVAAWDHRHHTHPETTDRHAEKWN